MLKLRHAGAAPLSPAGYLHFIITPPYEKDQPGGLASKDNI